MKSKLILIPTAEMSRENWLTYRHEGIGASEVGTILGLDDYMSSLELYYYKIGAVARFDTETIFQFMGRYHEETIADLWQYWDGDEESVIRNYKDTKIVRKCQRVNAFVKNPDYPWLYVSLDRKINKTDSAGEGTLELKTISGYEADKWEAGLPPKYVIQVNVQMLVCEFTFGEMAILQDGRRLFVLPFESNQNIKNHIIQKTKTFWDRVIEGRKLVNEMFFCMQEFNQRRVDELTSEIDRLAPEPDGTLVYADYLKKKFNRPNSAERKGTKEELDIATAAAGASIMIKQWEESKILSESYLKKIMGDEVQVLNFEGAGKVYWSKTANGNRIFRNKIKG